MKKIIAYIFGGLLVFLIIAIGGVGSASAQTPTPTTTPTTTPGQFYYVEGTFREKDPGYYQFIYLGFNEQPSCYGDDLEVGYVLAWEKDATYYELHNSDCKYYAGSQPPTPKYSLVFKTGYGSISFWDDFLKTNIPDFDYNIYEDISGGTACGVENLNPANYIQVDRYRQSIRKEAYVLCEGVDPTKIPEPTCADNYTLGQSLETNAVDSAANAGKAFTSQFTPGSYYAIEVNAPNWFDNGPPIQPSYESDIVIDYAGMPVTSWQDIREYPNVCIEELDGDRYRAYIQADINTDLSAYGIRAHDMENPVNYSNNNGDLNYTVYQAAFTPFQSDCAANYSIQDLRNTAKVYADRDLGYPLPLHGILEPNTWFALDVIGTYEDNDIVKTPMNNVEVSSDNGATFTELENWATCVTQIDWNHYRYFFKSTPDVWYQIRIKDDVTYWDNEGYLTYNLHFAYGHTPESGAACSTQFTLGTVASNGSVTTTSETGSILPELSYQSWYALETTGSWSDGTTTRYDSEIASFGTDSTYYDLETWPGASCVETVNDNHTRIYFQGLPPFYYRLRVNDTVGSFGNNSGSYGYTLYNVSALEPTEPPGTCEVNYETTGFFVANGDISANLEPGIGISLVSGRDYRIEISGGPWFDDGTGHYDVQISEDGGVTWATLESASFAGCYVLLSDGIHQRIYFRAEANKEYRLRVNDHNDDFLDNAGSIGYQLYYADKYDPEAGEFVNPEIYQMGCSAICTRPEGILEVANWLEYGRCEGIKYISWCDYHSQSFRALQTMLLDREPFATLMQFKDITNQIQTEINSYNWTDDVGGADVENAPEATELDIEQYLPSLPENSPYNNGRIELMVGDGAYSTVCDMEMKKATGDKLASPMCFALNTMDTMGITPWFNIIFNIAIIGIFTAYLWNLWLKPNVT